MTRLPFAAIAACIALAALCGSVASGSAHAQRAPASHVRLAQHGVARYVVRAGAADAVTRHAADEIADYLSRISGASFDT
ncbi:hypothetical protein C2U71_02105, partial [Burkholderia ubonensis]